MTVLLWGVPTEGPIAMVAEALCRLGVDAVTVHPRAAGEHQVVLGLDPGPGGATLTGSIQVAGRRVALAGIRGAYLRPVEPELVPELACLPARAPDRIHARLVHDTLVAFTEVAGTLTGCRVANRLSSMASNISKPYQAQAVLRHGFSTPATLISDDPDEVLDFVARHGQVVVSCLLFPSKGNWCRNSRLSHDQPILESAGNRICVIRPLVPLEQRLPLFRPEACSRIRRVRYSTGPELT